MSAISVGKHATADHMRQAQTIFDAIGRTLILDEKHMDAVTGLSASGPAFVYIIIESFVEAGVKVGLPRDAATQLAAPTAPCRRSIVDSNAWMATNSSDEITASTTIAVITRFI